MEHFLQSKAIIKKKLGIIFKKLDTVNYVI